MHSIDAAENKRLVLDFYEAVSGRGKARPLLRGFIDDMALVSHMEEVERAFPHYELIPEDVIAEADLVAVRGTFRGLHAGAFAGIPSSGRFLSSGLILVCRIREGRLVEHWGMFDPFGLAQS